MLEQCSMLQTGNSGNIWNTKKYWRWWARGESVDYFVNIDPANVEACHWLKSNNKGRKAILKLSRQKDSDEISRVRSKLKTTDLKRIGITTPVYINDSLCIYYKKLCSKCKKLWSNKFIFSNWVSNGSINGWHKICWVLTLLNLSVVYFCMGFIFYSWL